MIKLKNILFENTRSDVTLSDMFYKNQVIKHGESQIIDGPLKLFQSLFISSFPEEAKNMKPPMSRPDNDFGDNTSRAIAIVKWYRRSKRLNIIFIRKKYNDKVRSKKTRKTAGMD